jgi:hypothetical protein
MTQGLHLPALYRGKINLWVEDAITRAYLYECWNDDPDIVILIAGSHSNITAVLRHAHADGLTNVFGFADRDFRASNRPNWEAQSCNLFIPSVYEVENYLLDAQALADSSTTKPPRTVQEIEKRLKDRAAELLWWMACRTVIARIREVFFGDFIQHPPCAVVTTRSQAEGYISMQPWFSNLKIRTAAFSHDWLTNQVRGAADEADSQIASGTWRENFSGKELFHHVRDWVIPVSHRTPTPDRDSDLAKKVAYWQVESSRVPGEITALREIMRQRVGIK